MSKIFESIQVSDEVKRFVDHSFDVVNKIRWNLKRSLGLKNVKVGHAGTLDPFEGACRA